MKFGAVARQRIEFPRRGSQCNKLPRVRDNRPVAFVLEKQWSGTGNFTFQYRKQAQPLRSALSFST